ncbi:MAG: phage terminase large subunit [bacterium]
MPEDPPPTGVFHSKFRPIFPIVPMGNIGVTTRYCVITGGRGSGKSFALSSALASAMEGEGYNMLYTRWTMASAKDSIIPEFTEKLDMACARYRFDVQINEIRHRLNGSKCLFRGIKTSSGNQTAKLKSLQGLNIWVLDEAEEMPDEKTFDTIDLSIRDKRRPNLIILCLNPVHKRHWIYRRFFDGRGLPDSGFSGVNGDTTYIHSDYLDNWDNLPESYRAKAMSSKAGDPRQYRSIWLGAWMDEVIGALWTWDMIADHRRDTSEIPDMVRIVVAIDPSVSSTGRQDEVGIIVVGKGVDGHYYVLADYSGRLSPGEWAKVAINAYDVHQADAIIGETNQGGDLVAANIHNVRKTVKFIPVHASRGKITRAEPIATLYTQGLVHHVGRFPEQESELMSYAGYESQASPGRLDATVWGLTELAGIDQVASSAAIQSTAPNARR